MSNAAAFPVNETHKIALQPNNRLIAHSDGLGWHSLYGSLAIESPWETELAPVDHHCYVYCLNQPAAIRRSIDGERAQTAMLLPRRFSIIPARVASRWRIDGHPNILLLYLHNSMMQRVAAETFGIDPARIELIPRLASVDTLLEQLALSILDKMGGHDRESVLYVDNLAAAMAAQLLSRHSVRTRCGTADAKSMSDILARPQLAGLRRARAYLEANLGEDLTLDALAAESGMSTHYFSRAFSKYFGKPPHQFLLGRRIERAKELLRSSDLSLVDIAIETGFSSQSHLSSVFRRAVGVSPGVYRLTA